MSHTNSVLVLREQQLAISTRKFRARGYKIKRCEQCLLPEDNCICQHRPSTSSHAAFCFVMYKSEYYKPSNTGRIVADVIQDNHAFLWDRTAPDPKLMALLANPKYAPILVFPHQYAQSERCISTLDELPDNLGGKGGKSGKIPLFVMLDGTWREAKKMFRSPSLADIPVLGLNPTHSSSYQLREAAHEHQLCTAEVAVEVLKLANQQDAATALYDYFKVFKTAYIKGKPHLTLLDI